MGPCSVPSITFTFSVIKSIHRSIKSWDQCLFCRAKMFDDVTQMKNGNTNQFHLAMRFNPLMHDAPKWSDAL